MFSDSCALVTFCRKSAPKSWSQSSKIRDRYCPQALRFRSHASVHRADRNPPAVLNREPATPAAQSDDASDDPEEAVGDTPC